MLVQRIGESIGESDARLPIVPVLMIPSKVGIKPASTSG